MKKVWVVTWCLSECVDSHNTEMCKGKVDCAVLLSKKKAEQLERDLGISYNVYVFECDVLEEIPPIRKYKTTIRAADGAVETETCFPWVAEEGDSLVTNKKVTAYGQYKSEAVARAHELFSANFRKREQGK